MNAREVAGLARSRASQTGLGPPGVARRAAREQAPPTPLFGKLKTSESPSQKCGVFFIQGEVSRGGSRNAIYGVPAADSNSTPACLVIPARRFTSVPARAQGSANCPFGSAYVCHLGARPLQGREPSRIETVPFCLFCPLDPGAKPRPDIEYRMADVCGSGFRNQGSISGQHLCSGWSTRKGSGQKFKSADGRAELSIYSILSEQFKPAPRTA